MLTITIEYKPIQPRRKGQTHAISAALKTLVATPADSEGTPASFLIPSKHVSALRTAANDASVKIKTATEGENLRVWIATATAADKTEPLKFDSEEHAS